MAAPESRKLTPEDLLLLPDQGKGLELVDGELKELNMSFLSSFCAGRVSMELAKSVEQQRLGWVTPEGASYRCFPDNPKDVRRADTAFHLLSRVTEEQARAEGHCTVVPDIVVEVVSPNDLGCELERKRIDWLEAGAKVIWELYPETQTLSAYFLDGSNHRFDSADTLTGAPVLPDFRVLVGDFFRLPTASAS